MFVCPIYSALTLSVQESNLDLTDLVVTLICLFCGYEFLSVIIQMKAIEQYRILCASHRLFMPLTWQKKLKDFRLISFKLSTN